MSDIVEEKVFDNSLTFFWYANTTWGVQLDISTKSYKNLLHGIYQIHEMHEKTYQYEENVNAYLEMALINSIENGSYTINKESILDGIFDVETKTKKEKESKQRVLQRKFNH